MDLEWDNWTYWGLTIILWGITSIMLVKSVFATPVKILVSVLMFPIIFVVVNWKLG